MGSGYIMNAAVLKALKFLSPEEQTQALMALGLDYLVDTFGSEDIEDFETRSRVAAEWVQKAVSREFTSRFGKDYPFSVDIVEKDGKFKVSFFK